MELVHWSLFNVNNYNYITVTQSSRIIMVNWEIIPGKYSEIISFFFYYAGVLDGGLTCGVDWNELYSDETVY